MKRLIGAGAIAVALSVPALAQSLPPENAKPGECYAKVLVPAQYRTVTESVEIHPGGVKYTKIPAKFKTVQKKVLVKEESYELVPVPPTYKTVEETIMVEPERTVKTVVPATYRTVTQKVMISPAHVAWKAGRGAYEKINSATGDIMCKVEIPAQYKTITKQVIDKPAQTLEKVIPAKYITIQKQVVDTPATTTQRVIPAEYKTITVKEIVEPEHFEAVKIEPKYATIEKRELVTPESIQWRQILCETNVTKAVILRLQQALAREGYLKAEPNGNFGPATKAALRKFQIANGLPQGGLTLSTLRKLGVR